MSSERPPRLPRWIRSRFPDDLQGDLEESFRRRRDGGAGRISSGLWYYAELIRFLTRLPVMPASGAAHPGGFDMLRQDIRFAVRSLLRRPAFTAVITCTLALAIGANTTIFGLVNSLFLGALEVERPEQVIEVYGSSDRDGNVGGFQGFLPLSYPNFEDLRENLTTLSGTYVYTAWPVSVELGDEPERTTAQYVSAEYFDVLGAVPPVGRAFAPTDDDVGGAAPIAVVSHALWQERFGGDPEILGRTFRLNARSYSIVGVAPEGFRGTSTTNGADIFLPVSMIVDIPTWGELWENRGARFFFMGARVAEGRSVADADAELEAVWQRLKETYPQINGTAGIQSLPLLEARVNPNVRGVVASATAVLMGVVAVLLLIACMNVANLLLARAITRGREMAIRTSVGAGRGRLVVQLLTESLVLFGLGGVAGLTLAYWMQSQITGLQPPALFGATLDVRTDLTVLSFTALVTIGCGVTFGLLPAWRATRTDVASRLRGGDRAGSSSRSHRIRSALVVGQVCLSLVALVGAGLFLRALDEAGRVPIGFEPEGLSLLSVDLGAQGYTEEEGRVLYRESLQAVSEIPGVTSVAIASLRPLTFGPLRSVIRSDEDPNDPNAGAMIRGDEVSAAYLTTVGTSLLRGRDFTSSDDREAPGVAIVNERMAQLFWPDQDPIGERFRTRLSDRDLTVVGVVETGKYTTISEDPAPAYLRPTEQSYAPTVTYFVRTDPNVATAVEEARRTLQGFDPGLPIFDIEPATDLVRTATWNTRAVSVLLSAFGLVGLLLAAVGVYGVVANSVRERTREIGLRMALGAESGQVMRSVVGSSLTVTTIGVVVGLVLASVVTRPMAPQLFGVSSTDVVTYAGTAGVLLLVAACAAYLPARRAARVDPKEALAGE